MLCQFKCIKESRLYATKVTGEEKYPWSVTQLPRPIRAVALGRNFQQNDDSSAFQRILLGFTQDDETKEVLKPPQLFANAIACRASVAASPRIFAPPFFASAVFM